MIITCIIVTKDRPKELRRCLDIIHQQTRQPDQMIVVEGGASRLTDTSGIDYQISEPGITRQRNVARQLVRDDCDIVVYLDDDTELALDGLAHIEQAFITHAKAAGITGQIAGEAPHSMFKKVFGRLTLLYTPLPFGLTAGLFNIINFPTQAEPVAWLPGALMCFRWPVVKDLSFDEWFAAYGLGEDLDFSLQVKAHGELWVEPQIKIKHYHSPVGRDWQKFGYMRLVNRNYIRKKHFLGWGHLLGMWWANAWLLWMNGLRGLFSRRYRTEWLGECAGIKKIL